MKLKELPNSEKPRERLMKLGAKSLSDAELIAIIFRTGTKSKNVKDLAENLLTNYGGVKNLRNLSINKAKEIKGIGEVKIVTLLASLELGRRVYENVEINNSIKIKNSVDVFTYFSGLINEEKQENFLAIYLDNKSKYITHKIVFKGTINQSVVHPREVFKIAFLESASSIIIMHNHPSGDITPSKADDEVTSNFAKIGQIMGIKLMDHLIVSKENYYSYIESGRLKYV